MVPLQIPPPLLSPGSANSKASRSSHWPIRITCDLPGSSIPFDMPASGCSNAKEVSLYLYHNTSPYTYSTCTYVL